MSKETQIFGKGDWVVHNRYGAGQVCGTEVKCISGKEANYYRIETSNSTLWVPVDQFSHDTFRPVASRSEFKQVLSILKRPPRIMNANFKMRHSRIQKVQSENSLQAIARLVRDLWARQSEKSLSDTEQRALRRFTEHLLAEWAVCMKLEIDDARQQLHHILEENQAPCAAAD